VEQDSLELGKWGLRNIVNFIKPGGSLRVFRTVRHCSGPSPQNLVHFLTVYIFNIHFIFFYHLRKIDLFLSFLCECLILFLWVLYISHPSDCRCDEFNNICWRVRLYSSWLCISPPPPASILLPFPLS
jgi:hypothetical protein